MTQGNNAERMILEIEARALTCDYIAGCSRIKRMKMLEGTGLAKNIDELSRIYEHIETYCNDKGYSQCKHFGGEMLKAGDILFD